MSPRQTAREPRAFLGRGWRFPVGIDPTTGDIAMAEDAADVEQAIRILVETAPGERVMRPDLGCGAHDLVFSAMDAGSLALLEETIREVLRRFEPRIEVKRVEVETVDGGVRGELRIEIDYRLEETNREGNLVFPFYLEERV